MGGNYSNFVMPIASNSLLDNRPASKRDFFLLHVDVLSDQWISKYFCLNVALESPSRQFSSSQIHSSPNLQDVTTVMLKPQNLNILNYIDHL